MSTNAAGGVLGDESTTGADRRFVQVIDLYTREPAELERLLIQWRATSLAREHISDVGVARAGDEDGHLILEVRYDLGADETAEDDIPDAAEPSASPVSPEAGAVVALLDRPPRFRPSTG